MIKDEFISQYSDCIISKPKEYKLENIPSPAIFSVDCIFGKTTYFAGDHCDEFIFFNRNSSDRCYLIEQKTNTYNVSKIQEQLQGGASFIENFIKKREALWGDFDFMPVLVSKSLMKSQLDRLALEKVSLRGKKRRISFSKRKQPLPSMS